MLAAGRLPPYDETKPPDPLTGPAGFGPRLPGPLVDVRSDLLAAIAALSDQEQRFIWDYLDSGSLEKLAAYRSDLTGRDVPKSSCQYHWERITKQMTRWLNGR